MSDVWMTFRGPSPMRWVVAAWLCLLNLGVTEADDSSLKLNQHNRATSISKDEDELLNPPRPEIL